MVQVSHSFDITIWGEMTCLAEACAPCVKDGLRAEVKLCVECVCVQLCRFLSFFLSSFLEDITEWLIMLAVAFLFSVGVVYSLWAIDLGTGPVPLPFLGCVSNRYVAAIVPSSQSPCVCSLESVKQDCTPLGSWFLIKRTILAKVENITRDTSIISTVLLYLFNPPSFLPLLYLKIWIWICKTPAIHRQMHLIYGARFRLSI